MIQLEFDERAVETVRLALEKVPKKVPLAAARAINRAETNIKKNISKTVREQYIVKAATVKGSLSVKKASSGNLTGTITSTGRTLRLQDFKVVRRKRGPMRVAVKKGGAKPVKGLFAHPTKGLLHRRQAAAYPLHSPGGPSVPQMIGNEAVITKIGEEGQEMLNKRFEHEIERLLGGL